MLTPQETEKLFAALRNMKKDGKSIIIITHKLYEVLSISDRVATVSYTHLDVYKRQQQELGSQGMFLFLHMLSPPFRGQRGRYPPCG